MEKQTMSETRIQTLWEKALGYASFRALLRILRIAAAAGVSAFLSSLIPQLQAEPTIGGVPMIAILLLFVDKYLRDRHVY